MSLFHAERELKAAGRKDLAKIVSGVREAYGQDIPFPNGQGAKSQPSQELPESLKPLELDLDAEWQRQSQNFLKYGFHREGYDDTQSGKQAYLESLPSFEPQPQEYRGIFDRALLFEKRIPWERQAELAGILISDYLRSRIGKTRPWEDNPSQTPQGVACAAWFNEWGQRFPNKIKPFDARKQLTANEGVGDVFEGIAKEIHFPQDGIKGRYFDLIGTSVESDDVVSLYRWDDQPRLDARWSDRASDHFRPLVRGSRIVTR